MTTRSLIIIPTYEERANVAEVLRRVRASAPDSDVLVIDDNSADGTAEAARATSLELGRVDVIVRREKSGLGSAYRAGFAFGLEHGYDVLVEMDADLSHDPAVLPALLRAVDDGADLAIGSRYVPGGTTPGWPLRRRLLSRGGNGYARWMLRLAAHDATSGFRAFRATALREIDATSTNATGYGFQIELVYLLTRAGASIAEVPIEFADRTRGRSKMSARITFEALRLVTSWAIHDRLLQQDHRRDHRSRAGAALPA
jgi:dolichol-phosphate mannosyltransferase